MRYTKTAEAKSGNILARTVYGTDGRVLIRANVVLTPFLLQRLSMLGYQGIYIYDPGETDDMLRFALDERTRIRAAVHLQNIDLDKCIYMANEIVQQVLGMKDMAAEVNRISGHDLCTWTHSVDVCTYAVMCGIFFKSFSISSCLLFSSLSSSSKNSSGIRSSAFMATDIIMCSG